MRRRDLASFAVVLLVLAVVSGFVWATRHPDARLMRTAAGWPLVGPLIGRLRAAYLPAQPGAQEGQRGGAAPGTPPQPGLPPGELAGTPPAVSLGRVWVRPGDPLRAAPQEGARVLARADRYADLAVVERSGRWRRVRLGAVAGWIHLEKAAEGPPLGNEPEPPRPLPGRPAKPERLRQAVEQLGRPVEAGHLGPYPLRTDVRDPALLARLAAVAANVEPTYRERYHLEPVGEPAATVVLFSREASYRAFQAEDARLVYLDAAGHTGHGIVALFRGPRTPEEVEATLVHELTHLLDRRALGPALPPWLDEGLADDLGWCRVETGGRLVPGSFGGGRTEAEGEVYLSGSLGAVTAFGRERDMGRIGSLEQLVSLDWDGFVRGEPQIHYSHAALFVRFLLEGRGGALAPGFRRYLAGIAAGEPAGASRLIAALGIGWPVLDAQFRSWTAGLQVDRGGADEAAADGEEDSSGSSSRQEAPPSE